jgi:hypothetical protein
MCDTRVIGEGVPGPLTLRVMKRFRELVRSTGTPFRAAAKQEALAGAAR